MDVCANLLRWLKDQHSAPIAVAKVGSMQGLGYHSLFGKGHPGCPGSNVIDQIEDIVSSALGVEPTWLD